MRRFAGLVAAALLAGALLAPSAFADGGTHTFDHNGVQVVLGLTYDEYDTGPYAFSHPNLWTLRINRSDTTWVVTKVVWEIGGVGHMANSNLTGWGPLFQTTHASPKTITRTNADLNYNSTMQTHPWDVWMDTREAFGEHWLSRVTVTAKRGGSTFTWKHYGNILDGDLAFGNGIWLF